MKNFLTVTFASMISLMGISTAYAASAECQKLEDDYNLIYAAKGYCFSDAAAKAKYGNQNCFTTKPKFSEKEQQRLDQIKARQKELNCK